MKIFSVWVVAVCLIVSSVPSDAVSQPPSRQGRQGGEGADQNRGGQNPGGQGRGRQVRGGQNRGGANRGAGNRGAGNRGAGGGGGRTPIVVTEGVLPDADAMAADGSMIKVRDLVKGKYTVLKTGCLTCPEFLRGYTEIEALAVDYADKDVQFYYVFQSLRHPEREGYVQAQNTTERMLQMAEAKRKLETKVPWIADTIDDSFRVAMRTNSNSVFVISPDLEIVYAADRMNGDGLHQALSRIVGPVENPTSVADLDLPDLNRFRQTNITSDIRVERPEGMLILSTIPTAPEEMYLVKLRAEAEPALLETGKGRLFLGFYPDPIHDAHWNNLTPAMKYELTLPEGVTADPAEAVANKGPGNSDSEPRQFWVNIDSDGKPGDIELSLHYYGCTPEICEAMTHRYTIKFVEEDKNSRTFGFNRGQRGSTGGGQVGGNRPGGGRAGGNRPGVEIVLAAVVDRVGIVPVGIVVLDVVNDSEPMIRNR